MTGRGQPVSWPDVSRVAAVARSRAGFRERDRRRRTAPARTAAATGRAADGHPVLVASGAERARRGRAPPAPGGDRGPAGRHQPPDRAHRRHDHRQPARSRRVARRPRARRAGPRRRRLATTTTSSGPRPGPAAAARRSTSTTSPPTSAAPSGACRPARSAASCATSTPWSVLKLSLVFYLCVWLIVLVAGVILWRRRPTRGRRDRQPRDLPRQDVGLRDHLRASTATQMFRACAAIGAVLASLAPCHGAVTVLDLTAPAST